MKHTPYFADLHLHPTFKSFNWHGKDGKKNPWEEFNHIIPETPAGRFGAQNTPTLAKYSQTNFYKLIQGKVRIAFISLYPYERGFLEMRNVPRLITSKKAIMEMTAIASGMGYHRVVELDKKTDYFKEFIEEYEYVKKNEGPSPCGKYSYKVVGSYSELQDSLNKKNELAVIITCEGAHAFFDEKMWNGAFSKKELKEALSKRVAEVKSWVNPPLFMNLMHHFHNKLGGHAKSLDGMVTNLLNQRKGLEIGLDGLGLRVMKEMLSNSNGKRILIDTKHMSVKARIEYYRWLKTNNYINTNDKIPVICSHTGVNGFKTLQGSKIKADNPAKKKSSYWFNWGINLSDEEINIIHDSGGIAGLIIDRGKLGGGAFLSKLDNTPEEEKRKAMYMKLIWDNLFQVIRATNSKSGWDMFSLGTDYDGAINHVEFYDDATKLPDLYRDLYEFLDYTKYEKKLWCGYKPEELLDKLFRTNALNFLKKNFH